MTHPEGKPTAPCEDEPIPLSVSAAGLAALGEALAPEGCDLCRKPLATGDAFFRATVGMDDEPSYVGARLGRESTVEETSELVVCAGCEPLLSERFEAFLAEVWSLRAEDPAHRYDERVDREATTERSP